MGCCNKGAILKKLFRGWFKSWFSAMLCFVKKGLWLQNQILITSIKIGY